MAKPKKIDLELLEEMLSEKSATECAKHFGVSRAAISQAKRKLEKAVVASVAVEKAPVIIDKHLDIIGQLNKINKDTQELVDLCMAWTRGEDVAIQVLEKRKRKIRLGSKDDGTLKWVEEYKFKDPREIALKGMAEIRRQLKFQADLFKQLYEAKQVQIFIQSVIDIMGEMDVETRDKFIKRLRQQQIIFSSTSFY